jgi:hypothetical protein
MVSTVPPVKLQVLVVVVLLKFAPPIAVLSDNPLSTSYATDEIVSEPDKTPDQSIV